MIDFLYQKLLILTCLGSWAVKYLPQLTMDTISPSFWTFALKVMGIAEPQPPEIQSLSGRGKRSVRCLSMVLPVQIVVSDSLKCPVTVDCAETQGSSEEPHLRVFKGNLTWLAGKFHSWMKNAGILQPAAFRNHEFDSSKGGVLPPSGRPLVEMSALCFMSSAFQPCRET